MIELFWGEGRLRGNQSRVNRTLYSRSFELAGEAVKCGEASKGKRQLGQRNDRGRDPNYFFVIACPLSPTSDVLKGNAVFPPTKVISSSCNERHFLKGTEIEQGRVHQCVHKYEAIAVPPRSLLKSPHADDSNHFVRSTSSSRR